MKRIKYVLLFILVLLISGSVGNKKFITSVDIDRNVLEGNEITKISGDDACTQYAESPIAINLSSTNIGFVAGQSATIEAYAVIRRTCINAVGEQIVNRPAGFSASDSLNVSSLGNNKFRVSSSTIGGGTIRFMYGSLSRTVSVSVSPALTGFSYSISSENIVEGDTFTISINPNGSGVSSVSWDVNDYAFVTPESTSDSQATFKAKKVGNVSISMEVRGLYGETYYQVASIHIGSSFTNLTPSFSNATFVEGGTRVLDFSHNAYSGLDSIQARDYSSSVVEITNLGTMSPMIKAKKAGSTNITFDVWDKNGTKNSCTVSVTVTTSFTNVSVDPNEISIREGEVSTLNFTANAYTGINKIEAFYFDAGSLEVYTNNSSKTATVRGKRAGQSAILFKVTDTAGTTLQTTVRATVTKSFTFLDVNPSSVELNVNSGRNLSYTHNSAIGIKNVSWTSSNSNIAQVSGDKTGGTVVGISEGTTTIVVEVTDNGDTTLSKTINVTVKPIEIQFMEFKQNNYNVEVGNIVRLELNHTPQEANLSDVVYTSTNPNIATVSNDGVVRGVAVGVTTIKASKVTSSGVLNAYTTVSVSNNSNVRLSLNNNVNLLKVNEEKDLRHNIEGLGNLTFNPTWSSSDSTIVSVDNNGHIKGLKAGVATITVSDSNLGVSAGTTIEVIVPITKVNPTNAKTSYALGESSKLEYTLEPATATPRVLKWASSNPGVANVLPDGTVTIISPGEAVIYVTTQDGDRFDVTTINVGAAQNNAVDPTSAPGNNQSSNDAEIDNPGTGLTISILCVIGLLLLVGLLGFVSKYFNRVKKI